ncbi:MAG: cellulase family glycosylhydrolase [Planctomycetota bacterium]
MTLIAGCRSPSPTPSPLLERIVVAADSCGFVTARSRRPFRPWGMNYGNHGRLLEDYWIDEWPAVEGDLRELRALGANVVRVHLQVGRFLRGPETPDSTALERLARFVHAAAAVGLRVDVTGLGCYRPEDTPAWYDALDEDARWRAQQCFWGAVAATCAGNPAVFCYDLMNEPISPAVRRAPGQWASGSRFGGYDFLQYVALDPAGRTREAVAVAWIRRLTAAIRAHDRETPITVGLLPWSRQWRHLSGFLPVAVARELDFLSVHIYPDRTRPDEALESLRQFAAGVPVLIEETFPLHCDVDQLEAFMRGARPLACGFLGHYDGDTPDELDARERAGALTLPQAVHRAWLRLFVRLGPEFGS